MSGKLEYLNHLQLDNVELNQMQICQGDNLVDGRKDDLLKVGIARSK